MLINLLNLTSPFTRPQTLSLFWHIFVPETLCHSSEAVLSVISSTTVGVLVPDKRGRQALALPVCCKDLISALAVTLSSAYTFSHTSYESRRGGGAGLLLSQNWTFRPLSLFHLNVSSFHTVAVSSSVNLLIIVIYYPPDPLGNVLKEILFSLCISHSPRRLQPTTWQTSDFLIAATSLFHSQKLLSHPQRANALDLVLSHPSLCTEITATWLHISDDYLLFFSISLPVLSKILPLHLFCTLYHLPKPDFSSLLLELGTDTLLFSFLIYGSPMYTFIQNQEDF